MLGAVVLSAAAKAALVRGTGALSLAGMGPVLSLCKDRRLKWRSAKINPVAQKMQGLDLGDSGHHVPPLAILRVIQCHRRREKDLAGRRRSHLMKN